MFQSLLKVIITRKLLRFYEKIINKIISNYNMTYLLNKINMYLEYEKI